MKRNYSKLISVTLVLVVVLTAFVFPTPVYAGAKVGVWNQVQVAIYSESSGFVNTQIEGDNEAYTVEPGTKLFVVIQANFTSESKQQHIEVSWREWGTSTWAIASPIDPVTDTDWQFWDSEYDTGNSATVHFNTEPDVSEGAVYIENSTSDGGSPKGLQEFWFVVEAPTTEKRYELAISQYGVADINGTIVQQLSITVATPPPDVTNLPDSFDFLILGEGDAANTTINHFTLTNSSGFNVDVTIEGTDLTGGDATWALSDTATAGSDTYGLKAGLDDADDTYDIIVKKTAPNYLIQGLAGGGTTQDWGLEIYMPTFINDPELCDDMTAIVTLICTAS